MLILKTVKFQLRLLVCIKTQVKYLNEDKRFNNTSENKMFANKVNPNIFGVKREKHC